MNNRKHDIKNSEQVNKLLSKGNFNEILGKKKLNNFFAQVDVSSIVFFRIIFGTLMLIEVIRYLEKIERYWVIPKYHFYYLPFDFISPLPPGGLHFLFGLMCVLSVFIIIGFLYRLSMTLFFTGFTYLFLLEQCRYLNHFYLIILVSLVMIFIPANTSASIDRKFFRKISSETTAAWVLWILRFMIGLPYFFGGIAKMNGDWLQGEPMRMWLQMNQDAFMLGSLFKYESVILFIVYFGLLLDLMIVPLLLIKKTRLTVFILALLFHLVNATFFRIGIFPWFMIAATTIFFDPGWPRKFINLISQNNWRMRSKSKESLIAPAILSRKQKKVLWILSVWVVFHILLPLRHLAIPGNVSWTEEGHKFSWHMKLRTKKEIATFTAKNKSTGEIFPVKTSHYLTSWQSETMGDKPNLVWQFCQIIKEDFRKKGIDAAVYANVKTSLNGRNYQQHIDSTIDLASVPFDYFIHSTWILPLTIPLSDRLKNENGASENAE